MFNSIDDNIKQITNESLKKYLFKIVSNMFITILLHAGLKETEKRFFLFLK